MLEKFLIELMITINVNFSKVNY